MQRTRVAYDRLKSYMTRMFETGLGYPKDTAEISAEVLVEADARGHASHGVARIRMYDFEVSQGKNVPSALPEVVHETPVSLVMKGNKAPGFAAAKRAVDRTLEKAEKTGACMTVVRDSSHFGIAGYWAERAADRGMIGWAFTNTLPSAIPLYGRERLLGTNPVSVAIPVGRKPHFTLDMATTTVAFGKIEVASRRGEDMPLGWAVDERGRDTEDASRVEGYVLRKTSPGGGQLFLGGGSEKLGGHKGFGLGLLVELLTAGLSLGSPSYGIPDPEGGICHCFQAMRLDLFGDPKELQEHLASILGRIRESGKADGAERIFIHGEREFENRAASLRDGVFLDPATWERLDSYAEKFGLERLVP